MRNHDNLIVECLQEELNGFIINLWLFIMNKIISVLAKKKALFMPHPIEIDGEIFMEFSMSALLQKTLLGKNFEKLNPQSSQYQSSELFKTWLFSY